MQVTVTAIEGPTVNVTGGQEFTIALTATPPPVVNVAVAGAQGPPGPAGQAFVLTQLSPSSFWSFSNPVGRIAAVSVFDLNGEEVESDVYCDESSITVTFAQPFSGRVVVN